VGVTVSVALIACIVAHLRMIQVIQGNMSNVTSVLWHVCGIIDISKGTN
jgi:hypothetical protein